jgi:monoamine oxidase
MRHTPALVLVAALLMGAAPAPHVDDVLVIGAGLSGMSTAYYAKQAGLSFHVLESTPHLGGRMRSAKYPQGVAAEAGLAEFWEGNPALDIAHALKVPTDRGDTSFSSFYFANKFYPFTQDTNDQFLAFLLPGAERTKYQAWDQKMQGYFQKIQQRPIPADLFKLKDVSFADWLKKTSGLGPKGLMLVQTATEPEYATSWERISALDGIYEWHIFSGKGTGNQHIKGGNQKLAEAIADYVGRKNIEVNRQVTNVTTEGNTVTVTAMDPSDYKFHTYRAKHVVTTMPLFRLYEVQFTPVLSPKIREAIDTQTWGSYFTAHVIVDAAAKKYWQVNGQSILPILTGGPLGVCYEGESEHKGSELLNLLVTGDWAETFNARTGSFDAVREQLVPALDKQWPGFSKHIKQMTFVRYHPRAIASWPVGRSRFDALSELIRQPYGRIHFAGDFTEGTHSDGAVKSAQRVISQIAKAEGKKWAPPKVMTGHDAGVRAGHH